MIIWVCLFTFTSFTSCDDLWAHYPLKFLQLRTLWTLWPRQILIALMPTLLRLNASEVTVKAHINRWDSPSDKVMAGMVHRFLLFWFQTGWRWWLFTGGSWWFMFRLRLIWRYFEVVTWETETKLCLIQGANSSWKAMNPASGGFRYRVGWQAKAKPRQTRWVTLIKTARLFSQDQDNAYNK